MSAGLRSILCGLLTVALLVTSGAAQASPVDANEGDMAPAAARGDAFADGVDAYRRGAYGEAEAHWRAALERASTHDELARLAYDLGNAAFRRKRPFEAIGWYRVALSHAPRHADARRNMELVRAESGLEPDDRGDLRSTVERLLGVLRPDEARQWAGLGLGLLALALLAELWIGGRLARRMAYAAAALALLLSLPWLRHGLADPGDRLLVVRAPSVALRSEPRRELSPTGRVDAGIEVERIDQLPGWIRVRTDEGQRGWLQAEALFPLAGWGRSAPGS